MMETRLNIYGMTCENCQKKVKTIIESFSKINSVEVILADNLAIIKSDHSIDIQKIDKALGLKYNVNEVLGSFNESKFSKLRPLFLIFIYLIFGAFSLNYNNFILREFMLDFMGLFFIIFSFFKILDIKTFPSSFAVYDPIASKWIFYGKIYPFIETALGIFFLSRFDNKLSSIITIIILSFTTLGVAKTLFNKKKIKCACLGTSLSLPMTEATFIENIIMIVMAFIILI
tara:strand:+ start:15111 stop:15800 length:690 start_codon:yes stop_codon:yes gene_type:complete